MEATIDTAEADCIRRNAEMILRRRYGFYILIIAYPLISFRAVSRSPKKFLYKTHSREPEVKHKND